VKVQETEIFQRYHGCAQKGYFAASLNVLDPDDPVFGRL